MHDIFIACKKYLFLTCFILFNIFLCSFIQMLKYIHLFAIPYYVRVSLTLSWRRPLSYRNQSIDLFCKSNHWTGFYMITAPVMKELNDKMSHKIPIQKFAQNISLKSFPRLKVSWLNQNPDEPWNDEVSTFSLKPILVAKLTVDQNLSLTEHVFSYTVWVEERRKRKGREASRQALKMRPKRARLLTRTLNSIFV